MCGTVLVIALVLGAIGVNLMRSAARPLPEQAIEEAELTIEELQDAGAT
jgi:hypothetical protein